MQPTLVDAGACRRTVAAEMWGGPSPHHCAANAVARPWQHHCPVSVFFLERRKPTHFAPRKLQQPDQPTSIAARKLTRASSVCGVIGRCRAETGCGRCRFVLELFGQL